VVDTITLGVTDPGVAPIFPASVILAAGLATDTIRFTDYGAGGGSHPLAIVTQSRRQNTRNMVTVGGVRRIWTAGGGTTNWHAGANWNVGAAPASQDTVIVPDTVTSALYPVLAANVSVFGVDILDLTPGGNTPSISLGPFDLTAAGDVLITNSASISNSTGRLFLTGTGRTVAGRVPVLRVLGRYSLTGNLTIRAPFQVDAGMLTDAAFRTQVESF
jgi:hypothetical protein